MKFTKPLFVIGLFLAFAFITALFVAGFLNFSSASQKTPGVNNNSTANSSSSNSSNSIALTADEVAKHSIPSDCWVIVNGKVYDLTSFINIHSGGAQQILQFCGKDGSVGFNTKDGQGSHASGDASILATFYIGDLNQQISSSSIQSRQSAIANSTVPSPQHGEDNFRDD